MRRLLGGLLACLLIPAGLRAQSQASPVDNTMIQGEVTLPNGNPAANVTLQLQAESAGGNYKFATTDSAGYYVFQGAGVLVGNNYIIHCDVTGYRPIRRLVMVTGFVTQENFTLESATSDKPQPSSPVISVNQLEVPAKARDVFQKGVLQMEHERRTAAEASFHKAIAMYPKFAAAYMCLAAVYADQQKFGRADEAIHQAIALDSKSSNTYAYLGYVYMKENHAALARRAFRRSIGISSTNWFAQLEMGRLLYQENDFKGALPHLETAHKLHSQNPSVHLMLYDDLMRLNRKAAALHEMDDYLALFPKTRAAAQLRKLRPALAAQAAAQSSSHH